MKKIALVGSLIVGLVAIISLVAAINFGEKSPAYAEGKITLSPALDDKAEYAKTLFLVVFGEEMPMPYGAMKIRLDEPLRSDRSVRFRITKERLQVMNENRPVPRRLRIKARLDLDGIAGPDQPGDLTGQITGVDIGTGGLDINIANYIDQR